MCIRDSRVRVDEPFDAMPIDLNVNQAAGREGIDAATVDIGDEIPEAIDPQHDAGELPTSHSGLSNVEHLPCRDWSAQCADFDPCRQPRRGWCESVASFERTTDGFPRVPPI